jgi:hypothetical protein
MLGIEDKGVLRPICCVCSARHCALFTGGELESGGRAGRAGRCEVGAEENKVKEKL